MSALCILTTLKMSSRSGILKFTFLLICTRHLQLSSKNAVNSQSDRLLPLPSSSSLMWGIDPRWVAGPTVPFNVA